MFDSAYADAADPEAIAADDGVGVIELGKGKWNVTFATSKQGVDHQADLGRKASGEFFVRCKDQETILKKLSDGDAKNVLDRGVFHRPQWKRQAHVLARDDAGNYYYVDRLRDEEGGKGYRIFSGPAGGMKELPMTNVNSDSVGEIYATKKGELRLVTSNDETSWIEGGAKSALTRVPVEDNLALVYGDLGVYPAGLGTPCDDM